MFASLQGFESLQRNLWATKMIATDDKLPAVFRSRAAELNLEEAAITKASLEAFKKFFKDLFLTRH